MKYTYPLLLTGNISPATQNLLVLYDKDKRYHQYIDNIIRFISTSDFTHFVFCENSNTKIKDQEMLELLCKYHNKHIEFLTFLGDQEKTQKLTRAYGDQEIMEYAIRNSKILAEYEGFYKITGRYRIKNINQVLKERENEKNVFIRVGLGKNTVHTCFFKTTKSYFETHFWGKWDQLWNFENHSLERMYYHYIKQSWINMTIHQTHPIFSGERWSGGVMDESPWMQKKTKLFAKLGIYDIITTKI